MHLDLHNFDRVIMHLNNEGKTCYNYLSMLRKK